MPYFKSFLIINRNRAHTKIKLAITLVFLIGAFFITPAQPAAADWVPYCSEPSFNVRRYRAQDRETYIQPGYTMQEIKNSPDACREASLEVTETRKYEISVMTMRFYIDGKLMAINENTSVKSRPKKGSRSWGGR